MGSAEDLVEEGGEAIGGGAAGYGGVNALPNLVVLDLRIGTRSDESIAFDNGDAGFVAAGFYGEDGHGGVSSSK